MTEVLDALRHARELIANVVVLVEAKNSGVLADPQAITREISRALVSLDYATKLIRSGGSCVGCED